MGSYAVVFVDAPAILDIFGRLSTLVFIVEPVFIFAFLVDALDVGVLALHVANKSNNWFLVITAEVFVHLTQNSFHLINALELLLSALHKGFILVVTSEVVSILRVHLVVLFVEEVHVFLRSLLFPLFLCWLTITATLSV